MSTIKKLTHQSFLSRKFRRVTKISLVAVLALALVLGAGAGSAQAALTFDATSVTGSTTASLVSTTTNAVTVDSGTTGIVNIGTGASGKAINIGTNNTLADTIGIGSALDAVTVRGVTITIGTAADTTVSIADDNWSITAAGVITTSGNISQTGATTFSTGTGAISLNGDVTIAATKGITKTAGGGNFDFSAGTGTFLTSTGANTLSGNVTIPTGKTFTVTDGAVNLGTGALALGGDVTIAANKNITAAAGTGLVDLSAITHGSVTAQGLKLPTKAGAPTAITLNPEGHIAWDSTNNLLYVSNEAGWGTTFNNTGSANTWTGANIFAPTTVTDVVTIGKVDQTGTLTLGLSTAGQAINVASAAAGATTVVNILGGANSAGSNAVHIADGTTTGGTNAVTIGANTAFANTTAIQGGNGATAITLTPAAAGAIVIGGAAQTGNITLGSSTGTNAVLIGNGASTGGTTVSIANGVAATVGNTVNIASGNTATALTDTITIAGGTPAGTGFKAVTIGNTGGASSLTLQAGTGNFVLNGAATTTYTVGAATTTGTITIGGTAQTGATTIQSVATTTSGVVVSDTAVTSGAALQVTGSAPATMTSAGSFIKVNDGTSNVFRVGYNGHLTSVQATAPAAGGTCTTPAVAAGSTDTRGQVSSASCTASQTMTATFNKAYAVAPICIVSPANAAAAVTASAAAVTFASASTTVLTVTSPAAATTAGAWNYTCIE